MSGADSAGKLLLITYLSVSGEEQCAVIRVDNSYEDMLMEACLSLSPWLPQGWQNQPRDFAREVRNSRGDLVLAAIQPALVPELAQLGRLQELRLRIHPPVYHELHAAQDSLLVSDERSPAYEARPQPSMVDGIVQAVLHQLYSEGGNQSSTSNSPNTPWLRTPNYHSVPALEQPATQNAKRGLDEDKPGVAPSISPTLQPSSDDEPTKQASSSPPAADGLNKMTRFVQRVMQGSSKLVSEGKYESAIRTLRSTCNGGISPQERARLFLWLGQIGCAMKEYTNAGCDIATARNIFLAFEDRAGRIECDIVLAQITRERTGTSSGKDTKLDQLLAEAQRYGLEAIEAQLLCEICRLACSAKDIREDLIPSMEQAKAISQRLDDAWLQAETSRTAGTVSEASGDHDSALQEYSNARELSVYHDDKTRSPLSPINEVDAGIQRVKVVLSRPPEKPKTGFRKFF